jgi:hypothetical protein
VSVDSELVRRAMLIDNSGGNPRACRGCGSTEPLTRSVLSDAACDELGVLPFACRCGRHAQRYDVRLWSVPLPAARSLSRRPGGETP